MLPTDNEHATLVKGIYFQPRTGADYGAAASYRSFDEALAEARSKQKIFEYNGGKTKVLMRVWVEMRIDFSYEPSRNMTAGGGERLAIFEVFPHCVVAEEGHLTDEQRAPFAEAGIAELEKQSAA